MGGFNDFQDKANYFEVSSKLRQVSEGLAKILQNEQLTDFEKGLFDWAGDLFGQMDWDSPHWGKEEIPLGVFELATNLRPLFHEKINQLNIPLKQYSENFYKLLKSQGTGLYEKERINQLKTLYPEMSKEIFNRIHQGHI